MRAAAVFETVDPRFATVLGQAIRNLRKRAGMSQEELARTVCFRGGRLTRQQVWRIEHSSIENQYQTSTGTIERMLHAMGFDFGDLIHEIDRLRKVGALRVKRQGQRSISRPTQGILAKVV